jgi:hypothetical protein
LALLYYFRHYDYLAALFSDDMTEQLQKDIPLIQFDLVAKRMKTWTMRKRVMSSSLKKRIIGSDKVSTFPLKKADGTFF